MTKKTLKFYIFPLYELSRQLFGKGIVPSDYANKDIIYLKHCLFTRDKTEYFLYFKEKNCYSCNID